MKVFFVFLFFLVAFPQLSEVSPVPYAGEMSGGQDRGKFFLGRWAYAMYENNLPERQAWESSASQEADESGSGISSQSMDQLLELNRAQMELLSFLAGLLSALLVAVTWRYR